MGQKGIGFIVEGRDAEIGADEIKRIINDEFGFEPLVAAENQNRHDGNSKAIDPIALGALVLARAWAIVAVADLAGRLK